MTSSKLENENKWTVFLYAVFICFWLLFGCAAHNPPKLGAPPRWIPGVPAGGHYDCYDDRYEYNPKTMKCERKPDATKEKP
jgi:hypothetical protein